MPNLLLTTVCNLDCSYCFARGETLSEDSPHFISLEHVDQVAEFLKKSGSKSITLFGGEPTLHPSFPEIVARFQNDGFSIDLFTNGLVGDRAIECLQSTDRDMLAIVVNVNHPGISSAGDHGRVRAVLESLGNKAAVGFNIGTPDFDMEFLLDLIDSSGAGRTIRLGVAHPIAGKTRNAHMSPGETRAAGPRIVDFAERFDDHGINFSFDCGFLFCMFSEHELDRLRACRADLAFACRPTIDIGTGLDVWRCLPLHAKHRRKLTDFSSVTEAEQHFASRLSWLTAHGCLSDCRGCSHLLRGRCSGGCLVHKMHAFLPFHHRPAQA
jgi:hypothetical protein